MKDEIKEILDKLNNGKWEKDTEEIAYKILFSNEVYQLLDYITNLQEKYDKALTDLVHESHKRIELEQENKFLKLNNPEMNMEHFRIIKENKRKIDNLREENKRLKELCDKYEEEHSTKFNEWVFDKRENEKLNNVINELDKWIRWKMLHCVDYECFPEETLDKLKSLKEGK